jgi:hypothetical protein
VNKGKQEDRPDLLSCSRHIPLEASTKALISFYQQTSMPVLLQITFRKGESDNNSSPEAEAAACRTRAQMIAKEVPGLIWKIWIAQPDKNVFGGTYLFESKEDAEAYLASPIPDDIRHEPEFTTTIFEIEEEFSAICYAPLQRPIGQNT